jgi:transcriptional regulator with XRE-family HTH domain
MHKDTELIEKVNEAVEVVEATEANETTETTEATATEATEATEAAEATEAVNAHEATETLETGYYIRIIGSNIRYERKKRNLTIEDLAEIIGMAPGFLGLIERGQRGTSIKNLVRIAEIFSISLDQLVTVDLRNLEVTNVKEGKETKKSRSGKLSTLSSIIKNMSEDELEYIITVVKALRKLTRNATAPAPTATPAPAPVKEEVTSENV